MALYRIDRTVTASNGQQSYQIEAGSPEEAAEKINTGGGDFIEEELEVTDLDIATASDCYEIPESAI